MTCLGCNALESGPTVRLYDGRLVCPTCEDWRQECEARELLAMPRSEVPDALAERAKHRGTASVNALRQVMAAIFRQGQGK